MFIFLYAFVYAVQYFVSTERYQWKVVSRILSIANAIILSYFSFTLFYSAGWNNFFSYTLEYKKPWVVEQNVFLLKIFRAYLFVDLIFYLINHYQEKEKKDANFYSSFLHHLIGLICMQEFLNCGRYQTLSIYYAMTEISTITLHIAWLLSKRNPYLEDTKKYNHLMFNFAIITYVNFFIVRIVGALFIIFYYILPNLDYIFYESYKHQLLMIMGNGIIFSLNFYWFAKMTSMLLSKEKIR